MILYASVGSALVATAGGSESTHSIEARSGFLHQEDALAGGLRVEQAVSFLGLIEPPLVREQAVDIDVALDAEARAVGLALP